MNLAIKKDNSPENTTPNIQFCISKNKNGLVTVMNSKRPDQNKATT